MLKTEIYVSIDNLEFTKLDMFKDESFVMKYSKKELQDITKVFAPFSQNFSLPATPKNKQAFGFFGNTEVIKVLPDSKYYCKVYIDGMLNETGILKLESVKYKQNKADSFTANFNTNILSLKDRIGDTLLNDLGSITVDWTPSNVYNRLKSVAVANGMKYFCPLVSNNRVLSYDSEETAEDNIFYNSSNSPTSTKVLNVGELRPAVSMVSLLQLIKDAYNLTINTPLETRDELKEAYVWCNGENFTGNVDKKLILTKQFSNESPTNHGISVVNFSDSSIKITKNPLVNFIEYRLSFVDMNISLPDDGQYEKRTANVSIVRKSTLETVLSYEFEAKNGSNVYVMKIPTYLFSSNELEFYTYIRFSKPTTWRYNASRVLYRRTGFGDKISSYSNNYTSNLTGCAKVDLIKSLPNTKVIDFLTSFFKTFNISIYDSSPTDENLFFLTPQDINTTGNVYSKTDVDYTRYTDFKQVTKYVNNPYNYYNFRHKESEYKSTKDFKKQFGIDYGQTYYPSVKPTKATEFKVETDFTIVPPVLVNGSSQLWTFYGFNNEDPDISNTGVFRYQANTEDLTIFYNHGSTPLTELVGCQNLNSSGVLVNSSLNSYLKVMPYCKSNDYSLSFSILTIDSIEYTNSLFLMYYSQMITRLLNPNALAQDFEMLLPSSEIYLNDATILAGNVDIPKGFRLQNEVIIGETKYEILEASIDKTTGKTKMKLLNF